MSPYRIFFSKDNEEEDPLQQSNDAEYYSDVVKLDDIDDAFDDYDADVKDFLEDGDINDADAEEKKEEEEEEEERYVHTIAALPYT